MKPHLRYSFPAFVSGFVFLLAWETDTTYGLGSILHAVFTYWLLSRLMMKFRKEKEVVEK